MLMFCLNFCLYVFIVISSCIFSATFDIRRSHKNNDTTNKLQKMYFRQKNEPYDDFKSTLCVLIGCYIDDENGKKTHISRCTKLTNRRSHCCNLTHNTHIIDCVTYKTVMNSVAVFKMCISTGRYAHWTIPRAPGGAEARAKRTEDVGGVLADAGPHSVGFHANVAIYRWP